MSAKRSTATKKTAAAKKAAPAPEPVEQPEEQAAPGVAIANQAAFAEALGLNPEAILPNTMRIEFNQQGIAVVIYTAAMGVSPQQLSYAFAASSGMLGGGADGEAAPLTVVEDEDGE